MKYGIISIIIIIMASCSSPETEQSIREEIAAHKNEITVLNGKIKGLEQKLSTMNAGDDPAIKIAVTTGELSLEPFNHYIQVSGNAEAVKDAYISPELSGQIREFYVKEGDYVEKGQVLARLNTEITESNMADLQASLDLATTVYEKQKRLWEKGIGSEIQYLNAKNNKESLEQKLITLKAQLDMAILKAPFSGIVDEIYRKKGELALPGQQMMQLVNLEELYINADVSESYLGHVEEGEKVQLEFPVYPDMKIEAPIYRKGNIINPANRTFTIQVKLSNADHKLKPNILAVISIRDFSSDAAIVVSSALIKQDITGSYLYILEDKDGKLFAKKVYVTTGMSFKDKTMVIAGLQPGQKIIVDGFNLVSDGSQVYVTTNDAT
jgi:membrane fusion protein, multidrug efflux system